MSSFGLERCLDLLHLVEDDWVIFVAVFRVVSSEDGC